MRELSNEDKAQISLFKSKLVEYQTITKDKYDSVFESYNIRKIILKGVYSDELVEALSLYTFGHEHAGMYMALIRYRGNDTSMEYNLVNSRLDKVEDRLNKIEDTLKNLMLGLFSPESTISSNPTILNQIQKIREMATNKPTDSQPKPE